MDKKILNVLYQSDDNYILALAASITSLLENNQEFKKINIYYIGYKISSDNIEKLQKLIKNFSNADLFFIDEALKGYNHIFENLDGARAWNNRYITWYKLLAFDEIDFPTDRVLYLNPHTIITSSLHELTELEFCGKLLALSYDCIREEHKFFIGLTQDEGYYNCGVMLVNIERWKAENITQFCLESLSEKNNFTIVDQDFCNVMFREDIKLLGPEYNFSSAYYAYPLKTLLKINNLDDYNYYSFQELMAEYYEPKIIHSSFGLTGKPWEEGNQHPNKYLWDKYIKLSPWKDSKRPVAKRTLAWWLYNHLPKKIFMQLYKIAVRKKLGE